MIKLINSSVKLLCGRIPPPPAATTTPPIILNTNNCQPPRPLHYYQPRPLSPRNIQNATTDQNQWHHPEEPLKRRTELTKNTLAYPHSWAWWGQRLQSSLCSLGHTFSVSYAIQQSAKIEHGRIKHLHPIHPPTFYRRHTPILGHWVSTVHNQCICTRTSPSDRFLQLVSLYVSHETLILIFSPPPPPSSLSPCPPTTTSYIIIISRETDARRSSSSSHRVIIIGVIIILSTWASV